MAAWGEAFLAGGRLSLRFRRPVYDGEQVTVSATPSSDGYDVVLAGPDGSARASGLAEPPSAQREPATYDEVPLPESLAPEPRCQPVPHEQRRPGPWIHTASDCRFLRPAGVDEDVAVSSRVTELFSRKGHDYVRYDALVLAAGHPVAEVHHEAIWRLAGQEPPV